jgi:hypothetical protein
VGGAARFWRRGGNLPRPGLPPEGETGKGEFKFLAAAGNYLLAIPESDPAAANPLNHSKLAFTIFSNVSSRPRSVGTNYRTRLGPPMLKYPAKTAFILDSCSQPEILAPPIQTFSAQAQIFLSP